MADIGGSGVQIGLGEITDIDINNFGMLTGSAKPGSSLYESKLARLVERGGDELKGVSDPLEKIFSAVSSHIEKNGMTPAMRAEHNRISEAISEGREISHFNKMSHQAREYGEVLKTPAPAPAPAVSPRVEPVKMDMYHGGYGLDEALADPAKFSSARTPLPALTVSDMQAAINYAETGGPQGGIPGGNTYKLGLEFDSPERIVNAFEPASDDFINFMRNSLPEEGMAPPLVPGGKGRSVKYRDIFDDLLGNLKEEDKTVYGVMDTLSNVHDKYRPLGEYDYLPRAQGSIEARRYGIDALRWNDYGDDAIGLLDPHDVRSNVGRVNIKSVENITNPSLNSVLQTETYNGVDFPYIESTQSSSAAADDLIEPEIVKATENPTWEQYNAARAKGNPIVTEPYNHADEVDAAWAEHAETNKVVPIEEAEASAAKEVSDHNATKVTPLAEEYDTGATAAKVAEGKPVAPTPPPRKGPADISRPVPEAKTKPTPHGTKVKPSGPTIDTLSDLSAEEKLVMSGLEEGSPMTSKMGAKIVTETADADMRAMQALREMGGKMTAFREGGGKLLSSEGGRALSEAVTQGIKGSKNLRLAALGTAVGLGAYGASRFQHRRSNSDLQR